MNKEPRTLRSHLPKTVRAAAVLGLTVGTALGSVAYQARKEVTASHPPQAELANPLTWVATPLVDGAAKLGIVHEASEVAPHSREQILEAMQNGWKGLADKALAYAEAHPTGHIVDPDLGTGTTIKVNPAIDQGIHGTVISIESVEQPDSQTKPFTVVMEVFQPALSPSGNNSIDVAPMSYFQLVTYDGKPSSNPNNPAGDMRTRSSLNVTFGGDGNWYSAGSYDTASEPYIYTTAPGAAYTQRQIDLFHDEVNGAILTVTGALEN